MYCHDDSSSGTTGCEARVCCARSSGAAFALSSKNKVWTTDRSKDILWLRKNKIRVADHEGTCSFLRWIGRPKHHNVTIVIIVIDLRESKGPCLPGDPIVAEFQTRSTLTRHPCSRALSKDRGCIPSVKYISAADSNTPIGHWLIPKRHTHALTPRFVTESGPYPPSSNHNRRRENAAKPRAPI